MSLTYDPILGLVLPPNLSEAWGDAIRQNLSVLAAAGAASNCYFVSPAFTDEALHNAGATGRRHFPTIQAALDAIATGSGLGHRPTVFVYPHEWAENLVVAKTCGIVAVGGRCGQALGAGRGVSLIGANAQSPLITINPPNSDALSFTVEGFHLENRYSGTASVINNAQILKVTGQSLFGANPNYIGLKDCAIRAQTWGLNNDWFAALWLAGWNSLYMEDCTLRALNYSGGASPANGGIAHPIVAQGDVANGKAATVRIVASRIAQNYSGSFALTNALFYLDGGASLQVTGCPGLLRQRAYAYLTASGTNTVTGIGTDLINGTPATAQAYGNLLGIDSTAL